MPLTDVAIRNAKPREKAYKLTDGNGMFLHVQPTGSRYWRMKYSFAGKEKLLALGVYPEISLAEAREKRADARKQILDGRDPSLVKRKTKQLAVQNAASTLDTLAREWHKNRKDGWCKKYGDNVLKRLETDVFPKLGFLPAAEIGAADLLAMLRPIEERGATDTAHRTHQLCTQIFAYGIVTGRVGRNPSLDIRGALKPHKKQHYSHLKADELKKFLAALDAYDGLTQTKLALKLLLLTFVRTIELRGATWAEINFEKAEWRIPAERMKMKVQHLVPLSRQSLEVLHELKALKLAGDFLFPGQFKPEKFMSENTILYALYRMGYHGRTMSYVQNIPDRRVCRR